VGQIDLVRRALELGARDRCESLHGGALWGAAIDGNCETIELLLAHGSDPKAGCTYYLPGGPLGSAISEGMVNAARLLVR
jgi:hypothetical protein